MADTEENLTEEPAGLLSRWSRNKSRNRSASEHENTGPSADSLITPDSPSNASIAESTEPAATNDAVPATGMVDQSVEETSEDELILTDEDMPAIETLDADSDYSGFLNKGVSPELRQKALQHLFRMPKFNIRDGLNDYDEDYTYFEPLGDTVTSDMRWHAARKEREEREAREAEEARLAAEQEQQTLEGDTETEDRESALAEDRPTETTDEDVTTQVAESGPESTVEAANVESSAAQSRQEKDDAGQSKNDGQLAIESTETDDGSVV